MNSLLIDGLSFPHKKEEAGDEEEWRPIPGYVGIYEASNKGRIRSALGKTTSNARYPVRHWKQRILKQKCQRRKNGESRDYRVSLYKDGSEKTVLVARVVAMAWCEGYEDGLTVNHIDGDSNNNNANNLEWVSRRENIQKGFESGLYNKVRKACVLVDDMGNELPFDSLSEASSYLGKNKGYIGNCFLRNRTVKSKDGKIYLAKLQHSFQRREI